MVATVKKVTTFLKKSNKKRIVLKKAFQISGKKDVVLQSLCETRWVERITALERFSTNYVVIVRTLMAIGLWEDRNAKTKSQTLLKAITNSNFIMALFVCMATTDRFDTLSKNLQTVNKSLHDAMQEVQVAIDALEEIRRHKSTENCSRMFQ